MNHVHLPLRLRLLVPALATLLLAGCAPSHNRSADADATPPPRVRVTRVEALTLPRFQELAATVRPIDRAVVSARTSGLVLGADFALGQPVAAGEVLVTLEASETRAAVAAAEAALARVAGDFARENALLAKGAAASDAVRALADQRDAAAAALEAARARLAYAQAAAPFTGVVTRKLVNTGDVATPGLPLFEIEGRSGLRAECEVPASLPAPTLGTTLEVRLADGRSVPGRLVEISGAVDPVSRTRLAKLDLPANSGARYGDFVRVSWPAGESPALVAPAAAVSRLGQMERVFVVADGRARLRLVKTTGAEPVGLRIAAGLEAGELVVLDPSAALRDGQPVEIAP